MLTLSLQLSAYINMNNYVGAHNVYVPGRQGQIDTIILCMYAIKSKQTKNLKFKSE